MRGLKIASCLGGLPGQSAIQSPKFEKCHQGNFSEVMICSRSGVSMTWIFLILQLDRVSICQPGVVSSSSQPIMFTDDYKIEQT